MAEHEGDVFPDVPDEALEQHFDLFPSEDEQLAQALHAHYSLTRARQVRASIRAWERIQQARQPGALSTHQAGQLIAIPAKSDNKRKIYMKEIFAKPRPVSRKRRTLNMLVAAILLVAVVGSLWLVYSHFVLPGGTGSAASAPLPSRAAVSPLPTSAVPTGTGQISNGQQSFAWPQGTSTYWANLRYHQLTGYWVAWTGNADQWVAGAREAGWRVSSSLHMPSIVVLMPHVQGAGQFGHVGVVESTVNATTVRTSNMNWSANGSGWNHVSYVDFTLDPGVYFLWHS